MADAFSSDDPDFTTELLAQVRAGHSAAFGQLVERHRDRLLRVVKFRLDRRLAGRLDPEDVLQEATVEAFERLEDYLDDPRLPFFVWLRFITVQKLHELHRRHLACHARNADREVSLDRAPLPGATSADLAARLLGDQTTPSQAAARAELAAQLESALNQMDPIDREALALRHFERLANVEAAEVLGLAPAAASARYVRAVKRLRALLEPTLAPRRAD